MSTTRRLRCCAVFYLLGILLLARCAWGADGDTMVIKGKILQQPTASPSYPWRVRFYDRATGGNQVGPEFSGHISIDGDKRFEITLSPDIELARRKMLWMELHFNFEARPITEEDHVGTRAKVQEFTFHAGYMGTFVVAWPAYQDDPAIFNASATISRFDVKEFGAKGDGVTDDTAAIQAAINVARLQGGEVYLPVGTYRVRSLDATNINTGVAIRGVAGPHMSSRLLPTESGVNVLDLTGSVYMNLENFHIGPYPQLGQAGSFKEDVPIPKTGILLAQVPNFQSNAFHFDSVYVTGKYSVAAFYCYGVPSSSMINCDIWNVYDHPDAAVVAFSRDNYAGVQSEFTKVYAKPYGGFAGTNTSDWTISGCEIHELSNLWNLGGRTQGTAVVLDNTHQMRWVGGNISAAGPQYVHFRGENRWINIIGTTFYSDFGPSPDVVFRNDGHLTSLIVQGCHLGAASVFSGSDGAVFDEINLSSKPMAKRIFAAPGASLRDSIIQCNGLSLEIGSVTHCVLVNPGNVSGSQDHVVTTAGESLPGTP